MQLNRNFLPLSSAFFSLEQFQLDDNDDDDNNDGNNDKINFYFVDFLLENQFSRNN